MTKEYYSTKEVAEILGINRKTLLSLIKSNKIVATNIAVGSRALYRISREELDKFTNSNKYGERHTKN
jgi:excisionase family DNA binding protein